MLWERTSVLKAFPFMDAIPGARQGAVFDGRDALASGSRAPFRAGKISPKLNRQVKNRNVTWYLETERMRLRRFTADDLDWLAELHGDQAVMRYIDDGKPEPREDVAACTLPRILRDYEVLPACLGWFAAVSAGSGSPLGWFGLMPPSSVGLDGRPGGLDAGVELGYRLLRAAWGNGYATEGARAMVGKAFTEHGAERVVATTMTVNEASRRVLEKAGLSLVRIFFAQWPEYIDGAEYGDVVYAVSRHDWLARA